MNEPTEAEIEAVARAISYASAPIIEFNSRSREDRAYFHRLSRAAILAMRTEVTPTPAKVRRVPVQIVQLSTQSGPSYLFLCNDGTVWQQTNPRNWRRWPDVPQDDAP